MSIRSSMQQILDQAPYYSKDPTSSMRDRDAASADLRKDLQSALDTAASINPSMDELDLKVQAGGRRGYYSPLAWVRIYAPSFSPTATAGIYLVYLFAADGSRVY